MKFNCLIVDDEPIAQQILEKYISQIDALQLVGKCSNAFEALIGAIYLDGGFDKTQRVLKDKVFRKHLNLNKLLEEELDFLGVLTATFFEE